MTKFELLQSWYRRVWEDGDLDAIEDFFHKDAFGTGLVPELHVRPSEFRDLIEALTALIESPRFKLQMICESDDWITVAVTAKAQCRASGQPVETCGMVAVQVQDGLFLQAINSFDFIKFFEDLGCLPPGTMLSCLTGTRLMACH